MIMSESNCPVGWHYNKKLSVYQNVNDKVYVYITRAFGFYKLQLYCRSETGICELEARSEILDLIVITGHEWLRKYQDGDKEKIHKDNFSPHNPNGYWAKYPNEKDKVYLTW